MCKWWPSDMCYQMMAAALWQLSQLKRPSTPLNTCGRSNNEHSNQLRWASSMASKKKPEPVIGGLSLATPVLKHACGRQDCFRYSNCHSTTTTTNTTATNPTSAARPPTKHCSASKRWHCQKHTHAQLQGIRPGTRAHRYQADT